MKGISTIIATLLMLMITIGLAGMAYIYISGIFTGMTSKTIAIIDVSCVPGLSYSVVVKNLDTSLHITPSSELIVRVNGNLVSPPTIHWHSPSIPPGGTGVASISGAGAAGTAHRIRVVGPSNSEERIVYC